MMTVGNILDAKGRDVWTISPDATVHDALRLLAEKNVGALVVVAPGAPIGILSERDYARKVKLQGRSSGETAVREIMTPLAHHVLRTDTIEDCMALMTEKHVRHLPVLEEGRLGGIISIGDVVKAIIAAQESLISDLTNYITGKR